MFVTTPKAEWAVPKALVPDGGKCWMEFLIPAWTPWFLVTVKVQADNSTFLQAMAVAWEQTLLGLISETPVDAIAAIQVVAPDTERSGEWTVSRVKAVWLPRREELHKTGPLLFSFAHLEGVYDWFQQRVNLTGQPRELIWGDVNS